MRSRTLPPLTAPPDPDADGWKALLAAALPGKGRLGRPLAEVVARAVAAVGGRLDRVEDGWQVSGLTDDRVVVGDLAAAADLVLDVLCPRRHRP